MKKILAILLALATLFSLCSCSLLGKDDSDNTTVAETVDESKNSAEEQPTSAKDTETTTKKEVVHAENYITSTDDFIEKLSSLIDTSIYTVREGDNYYTYEMDYDLQKETSYDIDYSVKLGDGTNFALPVPVKEFEKQGWTISQNPEVKAGYVVTGPRMESSQGNYLWNVSAANLTDDTLKFNECDLVGCKIELYTTDHKNVADGAIDFIICDTITEASTLEDIIKRLGNPTIVSCNISEYNGEYDRTKITLGYEQLGEVYDGLEFELSGDGNYIVSVKYRRQNIKTIDLQFNKGQLRSFLQKAGCFGSNRAARFALIYKTALEYIALFCYNVTVL